jgi:hypothetical protein
MYKLVLGLGLSVAAAACNNVSKTAGMNTESKDSTTETKADWVYLFDGQTTKGWHSYGKTTIGKAWKVADSTLYLDAASKKDWQTAEGGDIVTDDEFENFHLSLEWKIAPKGNSGIIFFINEDTTKYDYVWKTGPEMQVLDNAGHPDAKIVKHRAGDLYDLITSKETVKPAGEWNHAEIIANKGDLRFRLNNEEVLHTTMWDDHWRALIAGSKFKDMPGFGTFKKGKIALQDHGDNVWYRNIKIMRL